MRWPFAGRRSERDELNTVLAPMGVFPTAVDITRIWQLPEPQEVTRDELVAFVRRVRIAADPELRDLPFFLVLRDLHSPVVDLCERLGIEPDFRPKRVLATAPPCTETGGRWDDMGAYLEREA